MFLSMGQDHTYKIPLSMFQENRNKLWKALQDHNAVLPTTSNGHEYRNMIIILQGGEAPTRYDTDHEPIFRQESYFWWLTGVKEPDCWLVLLHDNNANLSKTILLIPKLPAEYATIMGRIKTPQEWKDHYQVDEVLYTCDLEQHLLEDWMTTTADNNKTSAVKTKLFLMEGPNTDSGNMYKAPSRIVENSKFMQSNDNDSSSSCSVSIDKTTLFPILAECRVIKSPKELQLLEHVSQVSSFAHTYVMRNTKLGMYEYQCESLFKHYAYYNYGSRLVSYTSICGCGPNAAILHYGHAGEPNARQILTNDDNCLFDMGAEYQCYASDITCSFPASGKFSKKYKAIYNGVLQAQIAVYNMAKPGISWIDCHKAAELEILKALHTIGIVILDDNDNNNNNNNKTKSLQDLVELRLGAVFMPHGLGHFIGIDTHDVGGYLPGHPERSLLPGLRKLRTARILQENMVLTVEPGCYFIDHLIQEALNDVTLSPYLNRDLLLKEYTGYGGVRLEDVVMITSDGLVNFTVCPRTPEEIEHVMAGGKWPPLQDAAPELRRKNLTAQTTILLQQPSPPSN